MDFSYYLNGMTKVWKLQNKGFKTILNYQGHLRRYLEYFKCFPETITREQRWDYFLTLNNVSHRNQAMAVIRQLHLHLLNQPIPWQELPYGKKPETLPEYFTEEEISRLLSCISNHKHRCMIAMQYLCGLRVSELCTIKITDLNTKTKVLRITGKGGKQREIAMPPALINYLKLYWHYEAVKPTTYLFPGQYGGAYTARSVQEIVAAAKNKAGLQHKKCSTHGLRHGAATMRINKLRWDLREVQVFLGHKNAKTTERYTHVGVEDMKSLPQPTI